METVESAVRRIAERNLLRYAVGRAISCPTCGNVMDASRAVLVTAPAGAAVSCAACWRQGARCWSEGGWSVLDGRVLFAKPPRTRKARRLARHYGGR